MAKLVKLKRKAQSQGTAKNAPEMQPAPSYLYKRFGTVALVMVAMLSGLVWKVADIQIFDSERLIEEANNRSLRTKELPFTRGRILDRDGRFLSISVPVYSITIDPREYFDSKVKRTSESWKALAIETGSSKSKIEKSVSNFLERKNKSTEKVDFDPRAILNSQDAKYWDLLADVSGIEKSLL